MTILVFILLYLLVCIQLQQPHNQYVVATTTRTSSSNDDGITEEELSCSCIDDDDTNSNNNNNIEFPVSLSSFSIVNNDCCFTKKRSVVETNDNSVTKTNVNDMLNNKIDTTDDNTNNNNNNNDDDFQQQEKIDTTNTNTNTNTKKESSSSRTSTSSKKLPHILLIVMDDLGSNDLGLHGTGIQTPVTDQLATTGTIYKKNNDSDNDNNNNNNNNDNTNLNTTSIYLSNYYVLPYCSPTRASLLSGRYPLHTGLHQIIVDVSTDGLPINEETLSTILLQQSNYSTHAIGKWHLGHSQWEMTPTYRGFQSFYGFYLGWSDYYTHYKTSSSSTSSTMNNNKLSINAYDLRYDSKEYCGANCSQLVDERGNYSTHVFTREAIRIIQHHEQKYIQSHGEQEQNDTNNTNYKPLFLYLAYQAVHYPDQVPDEYLTLYENNVTYNNWTSIRKVYAAMLTAADVSIGHVLNALQNANMWDDTIVIYTTDNGGPTTICAIQGSSNGNKRGGKCTIWEGGTTGDSFIAGPGFYKLLYTNNTNDNDNTTTSNQQDNVSNQQEKDQQQDTTQQQHKNHQQIDMDLIELLLSSSSSLSVVDDNTNIQKESLRNLNNAATRTTGSIDLPKYPHLFHVVDWLPTIAEMVGATPAGLPLDGVSHFSYWKTLLNSKQRQQYNKNKNNNKEKDNSMIGNDIEIDTPQPPPREELFIGYAQYKEKWYGPAIRYKQWKLIQGIGGGGATDNVTDVKKINELSNEPEPGGISNTTYQLYNLYTDPSEVYDIANDHPLIVQLLQSKLRYYQLNYIPPIQHNLSCDPFRGIINTSLYGPTWTPWCSQVIVYQ